MNQPDNRSTSNTLDDELTLQEILLAFWSGKWLIGGITFVVAVTSIVVVLWIPDIYRAGAVLIPNDQDSGGGLSALAARYGGLANLAGIDIGGGSVDKTALGIETLKSRKFISEFIVRHDILVPLMAAKKWDSETDHVVIDSDVYDAASETWVRSVKPPRGATPSLQEAYEVFVDRLSVGRDKKTGYVNISIEHYSPHIAKQWVDWLVEDVNLTVMRQDVAVAEQKIDYLNAQVMNTSLTGLQQVFFRLIEEQTKVVVLAEVSDEYLFKTLDPAIAPEKKARPMRALIVVLATVFGGFLGVIVYLIGSGGVPRTPKDEA